MADFNIILNILETLKNAKPDGIFINSLHQQYCNRGGLSKKQLEGLHAKATKSGIISTAKLATLEAIIKKKPTRYKSEIVIIKNEKEIDNTIDETIVAILEKFPTHKMALFFQSKRKLNSALTDADIKEIKRLGKLLLK